jgi:hypothetical protein
MATNKEMTQVPAHLQAVNRIYLRTLSEQRMVTEHLDLIDSLKSYLIDRVIMRTAGDAEEVVVAQMSVDKAILVPPTKVLHVQARSLCCL